MRNEKLPLMSVTPWATMRLASSTSTTFTIISGSISSDTVPLIIVPGAWAKPASGKAANAPKMICRYRVFIQFIRLQI